MVDHSKFGRGPPGEFSTKAESAFQTFTPFVRSKREEGEEFFNHTGSPKTPKPVPSHTLTTPHSSPKVTGTPPPTTIASSLNSTSSVTGSIVSSTNTGTDPSHSTSSSSFSSFSSSSPPTPPLPTLTAPSASPSASSSTFISSSSFSSSPPPPTSTGLALSSPASTELAPPSSPSPSAARTKSATPFIVAGVIAPFILVGLAVTGVLLYKRRRRARDRREWERTHEEIADAVRQVGTPAPSWARTRSDTELLHERGGSVTDPLFYTFPAGGLSVADNAGDLPWPAHSPSSSLS
ncbi:hypothetical protein DFH07DRAFT_346523 [Mycena maculata]|uniref:Uncharacterized protein n=1 Tax=Mycena maculata TaxID=230809 RepID=A0AAD7HD66_9AGAR|nr:hypothetical protein DFH07DRAFT_346523 [Mycena maculata]